MSITPTNQTSVKSMNKKVSAGIKVAICAGLTMFAACAIAQTSMGQGLAAGEIAANGSKSASSIYKFMMDAAMLIGLFVVIGGLWMVNQSKKDEGRTKMSTGWFMVIIGSLLLAVPFVIASSQRTLSGDTVMRQNPTTIR